MKDKATIESDLISNVVWAQVFELLLFMHNDIFPEDFKEYSPNGIVKVYFQNKYKITYK